MMEGDSFTIIGYEIYENAQYLICNECGYTHTHRINVEKRIKNENSDTDRRMEARA